MRSIASSMLAATFLASASFAGAAFALPGNGSAPGLAPQSAGVMPVAMKKHTKKMTKHKKMDTMKKAPSDQPMEKAPEKPM